MNLPNKLTVFRVILVVPFVILLLGQNAGWGWFDTLFGGIMEYMNWITLVLFVVDHQSSTYRQQPKYY